MVGACILELAQDMQRVVPAPHTAGSSTPFLGNILTLAPFAIFGNDVEDIVVSSIVIHTMRKVSRSYSRITRSLPQGTLRM